MGQTITLLPDDHDMDGVSSWRPEDAPRLVLNYLVYNCHQHTAAAFLKEWLGDGGDCNKLKTIQNSPDWKSLEYRSSNALCVITLGLTELIRDGLIEESLKYMEEFFPNVIIPTDGFENPLKFSMQCQYFVEMIKQGDTEGALEFAGNTLAPVSAQHPEYEAQLQKIIVLLAYADPINSPAQSLLGQSQREELAIQVNAAILGYSTPTIYQAVQMATMETVCSEAGISGPKRTERQVMEALAGRSFSEIFNFNL